MRALALASGLAAALLLGSAAHAADVVHTGAAASPIATTVTVPAGSTTVYVSGLTPDVTSPELPKDKPESYGDTTAQTINTLTKIQKALQAQGMDMRDVVSMHVYLVGDPAKGGKMDFMGMMAGYLKFFGNAEQPNKPSRTTIQVPALANPSIMVEIDVVAAKPN